MSTPMTFVADRYRLVKLLGAGGMGVVWQAWDERLHRTVALKMLRAQPELTDQERQIVTNRAMREARITAGLHHPHAVTVFDVVEHEGRPCLVMQLIESTPLSTLLKEHGALTPAQTARIGADVSSALAAAHRLRIVHRDVKPGNILITEDGSAMISDFGISHALGDATITATGMIHGTPAYLAPEVARGQESKFASDVFSLGSTLYAMLEGAPPFGAENNAIALLHKVARGSYPAPRHAGPLAPLLREMLSADPKRRPDMASVSTRLAALRGLLGEAAGAARPAASAPHPAGAPAADPAATEPMTPPPAPPDEPVGPPPKAAVDAEAATPDTVDFLQTRRYEAPTLRAPAATASTRTTDAVGSAPVGAPATAASMDAPPAERPATADTAVMAVPVPAPSRERPPNGPPPPRPQRRRRILVGLLLVAAAVVVALWVLTDPLQWGRGTEGGPVAEDSPGTSQAPSTAQPPTPSATPTAAPEPSPTTSEAPTPPTAPEPGATPEGGTEQQAPASPAERAVTALTSYYALLPADLDSAWPRMTTDYQVNHVGGRAAYENFWNDIAEVAVSDVTAPAADQAQATLTYYFTNGRVVREVTAYTLTEESGTLKIAATTVLSSVEL